jgi:hypothetical protein
LARLRALVQTAAPTAGVLAPVAASMPSTREDARAALLRLVATKRANAASREPAPDLVLVSCSDEKLNTHDGLAPASRVYTSPLFRLSLEYARTLVPDDRIRILSAKYGVLGVDELIASYDYRLRELSKREREAWGERVVSYLTDDFGRGPLNVVVLAGVDYVDAVRFGAWGRGWRFRLPFGAERGTRLPIGRRLQWLRRAIERAGARANPPADEERARVVDFLHALADQEETRDPNHHRPHPTQLEVARRIREAAALIQRRSLDTPTAIAHLRDVAANAPPILATRLYFAAKGVERSKHRSSGGRSAHQPNQREEV